MANEIKIADNLTITERISIEPIGEGKAAEVHEYYVGDEFVFGTLEPFSEADLYSMYVNGYFDDYIK